VILSKGRTDGWKDPQSPPQPNSHINVILGKWLLGTAGQNGLCPRTRAETVTIETLTANEDQRMPS
jgi:hypothetical protein